MKNIIKIMLILFIVAIALFGISSSSNAATTETANDEESLINAIQNVDDGGTVEIQNNITVTKPIVIQKELIIDGNGYTIVGSTEWTSTSGNQTMFTAQLAAGKLTLKDIALNNGPKYGVQSYDGATVILDNVSITGFRYGGVLANGGNIEVKKLHLGYNGTGANNGIEIDKGSAATNNPSLIMNGVLTSDSNENVVRPAENGYLTEFTVTNTENTTNKVVIAGDRIVFTDKDNNVISEASIPENATVNADTKKVVVTLIIADETERIVVDENSTISADLLKSHIELKEGYKIDGYFTDAKYTKEFDFNSRLDSDITIYVKTSKIQNDNNAEENNGVVDKDEIPKTGEENYLPIASLAILASACGIMFTRKKEI